LIYIPNAEHYCEGIYRAIWIESDWEPQPPTRLYRNGAYRRHVVYYHIVGSSDH
jgi:hypothetical protein